MVGVDAGIGDFKIWDREPLKRNRAAVSSRFMLATLACRVPILHPLLSRT